MSRTDALEAAAEILLPLWDRGEPGTYDIGDLVLLARYIETGKHPYEDERGLPSPDAMRSHP